MSSLIEGKTKKEEEEERREEERRRRRGGEEEKKDEGREEGREDENNRRGMRRRRRKKKKIFPLLRKEIRQETREGKESLYVLFERGRREGWEGGGVDCRKKK